MIDNAVDYDAPVAENGDLTEKYHHIRKILSKELPKQGKNASAEYSRKINCKWQLSIV